MPQLGKPSLNSSDAYVLIDSARFLPGALRTPRPRVEMERSKHLILLVVSKPSLTSIISNYCHGVADGLTAMARRERKEEEQKAIDAEVERLAIAKREEAETRRTELTRLEGPNLSCSHDHKAVKVKPEPEDTKPILQDEEMDEEEDVKSDKPGVKVEEVPDEDEPHRPTLARPLPDFPTRLFNEDRFNFSNGAGMESDDDSDNDVGNGFGDGYSHERDADFVEGDDVDDLLDLESAEPKVKVKPEPIDDEVIKPQPSSSEDDTKEPMPVKPEPVEPEASWQSEGQLIQFRNDASRIADQFLESKKDKHGKPMKLKTRRPTARVNIKDAAGYKAYRKGEFVYTLKLIALSDWLVTLRKGRCEKHRCKAKAYQGH